MNKLCAMLFAVAMLALAAGCRHTHLGDDTGVAYRDAIQAQRESDAEEIDPMDARDAKKVLSRHRRGKSNKKTGSRSSSTSTSSSSSSGGSGVLFQGATGPIRLDAK